MPNQCGKCKGTRFRVAVRPDTLPLGSQSFTAPLRASTCATCGDETVSGTDLSSYERELLRAVATTGRPSDRTFFFMRRGLHLKAADLARLLDTTPETVSRWENGEREVPRLAWTTLACLVLEHLDDDTRLRDRLTALSGAA